VPRLALVLLRGAVIDAERHAAVALPGVGLHLLEVVELLELLLHSVQHLILDLLRRGAGPDDHDGHRRHREVRVLELAEPGEAERAAHADHEDQEEHDGAVLQRPFGKVDRFHREACFGSAACAATSGSATRRPGAILCTPAVTTSTPAGGPETSTSS